MLKGVKRNPERDLLRSKRDLLLLTYHVDLRSDNTRLILLSD